MKVTIELNGYRMVIEPESVEEFELHTPLNGGKSSLTLAMELTDVPLWEAVTPGGH